MMSQFTPRQWRAVWLLGSLWAVAIVFIAAQAVIPG